jgi:bacteriorhodopsin
MEDLMVKPSGFDPRRQAAAGRGTRGSRWIWITLGVIALALFLFWFFGGLTWFFRGPMEIPVDPVDTSWQLEAASKVA